MKTTKAPRPLDDTKRRPKPHVHTPRTAFPKPSPSGLQARPFLECTTCYATGEEL